MLGMMQGFAMGITLAKATNIKELSDRYFALDDVLSPNDYLAGLNQFCADPANVLVTPFDALEVVSLKITGASPAQIEEKAALIRSVAAKTAEKKPDQKE